jgi:hypothetical protein
LLVYLGRQESFVFFHDLPAIGRRSKGYVGGTIILLARLRVGEGGFLNVGE